MIRAALLALSIAAPAAAGWDAAYEPPRMPDGTPSLEGNWTNASLTTLERPEGVEALVLPEQAAQALEARFAAEGQADDAELVDPDAPPPDAGEDVGGYNRFWIDPGARVAQVGGEYRSSWIIDPADGRLPLTERGRELMGPRDRSPFVDFDNPEARSAGERCTVGFGSTGGPPMLNVLYNNHYQIVQAPETVAIRVEMNHDTRLIRMNGEHLPDGMHRWLGDSVGRWDGDTLVVRSTNFHPGNALRAAIRHRIYVSPDAEVEERFTRVADDAIRYRFTVTDPDIYTQPWTGEMVLRRDSEPIFEYACHEGNYSLPGILAGARREEAEAVRKGSE